MSEPQATQSMKMHGYGPFAVAVAFYVIGVVAFSIWSYIEHQAIIGNTAQPHAAIHKITLVESLEGLYLFAIAFPLIGLYHRARARSSLQLEDLNARLQKDFKQLKKREAELEDAIRDLERFNAVATGREQRILELKSEVNGLLQQMDQPKRYNTNPVD